MPSFDYSILETLGSLATAVASVILVFLLWRTVKQMEYTVKLSKIQTEHISSLGGPERSIKHLNTTKESDRAF